MLFGPWHPLHLAKFGATIDHISGGRWGINVVTGYAPREARMFGGEHVEHDRRYEMAGEFTDILCRLWGETEDLTLQGKFWSLEKAFVTPKPRFGRPSPGECDGFSGRYRLRRDLFRPCLHHQSGRARDRRGIWLLCRRITPLSKPPAPSAAGSCARSSTR